jgi:hypothetical protein
MRSVRIIAVGVLCVPLVGDARAQVMEKKTLTLDGAKRVLDACETEAGKSNATGVIAVVDDGGDRRMLNAGDVLVIPRGVPHSFKEVTGTFLYYVVKVRS